MPIKLSRPFASNSAVTEFDVRPAHAQYNRTIRKWSDSPDPGDDFGCRCWAQNIPKEQKRSDAEVDLVNTNSQLFIANQEIEKAKKLEQQLKQQLENKSNELKGINSKIEKEKQDKVKAQNIGGFLGGTVGAALGSPEGIRGASYAGGIGVGVGRNIGRFIEEGADAISKKSETDLSLNLRKQKIIKEIKALEKDIQNHAKLKEGLLNKLKINQESVINAKKILNNAVN